MPIRANNFKKFSGDYRREMKKRITRAAIEISRHAKGLVSVAGPSASRPGQPPHKQTGRLRASIAYEVVGDDRARVGTNVRYGRYLEQGTKRMAARPWLVRSAEEKRGVVVSHITRSWNP